MHDEYDIGRDRINGDDEQKREMMDDLLSRLRDREAECSNLSFLLFEVVSELRIIRDTINGGGRVVTFSEDDVERYRSLIRRTAEQGVE